MIYTRKLQAGRSNAIGMTVVLSTMILLAMRFSWAAAPIGLPAIERLQDASMLRPGVRTYQFSSHDPTGGHSDANNVLQTIGNEDVLLDVKGPGCIYRIWQTISRTEDPAGKTIRIYFDGSSTPTVNMSMAQFYGGSTAPFLSPLVGNNNVSSGGFYCYVPMPFQSGCRITLQNGGAAKYFNITYHKYADATGVTTFTGSEDTSAARSVWNNAGSDPKPDTGTNLISNTINIGNGSTATLADITGAGTIQELEITIPGLSDSMLTSVGLRAKWDGSSNWAIDVPMGYFFGCGLGVRNTRHVPVGTDTSTNRLYCYLPMPYGSSAIIQLVNNSGQTISNLSYNVRYTPQSNAMQGTGYLNAKYLQEVPCTWGTDFTVLNETGGGQFIGLVQTLTGPNWGTDYYSSFMEGDERIHVDGSLTPQLYGTGTEDLYNGGYYFDHGAFNLPVHGNPIQTYGSTNYFAVYRHFLSDMIPFTTSIKFGLEHNSVNNGTPNYYSVAFYYKSPQALSTLTDTIDIGDSGSESAHSYTINGQTWSGSTGGYYEGDDDGVYVSDNGRRHNGYSQFVAAINATNGGLIIRRRMDYSLPRQDAEVYIDNQLAGRWYDAGSNNSKIFRDSEFLVSPAFTSGKSSVTIKIVNMSGESNWTEYYYWVYSLASVTPDMNVTSKPAGTITIDGNSSDWNLSQFTTKVRGGQNGSGDYALIGYDGGNLYYGGYWLSGVLPTSASDHTAKVYCRNDSNYLYFLSRCDDSDMRYNNPTSANWLNDCVEFFIDPSHDHGSSPINNSTSDVQLDIDANNQKNVYMCASGYTTQVLNGVTSAVVRDGTGWWLEARISKTALDPDLVTGTEFGLDLNFRDNDNNNDPSQTTIYTWADTTSNGESKVPNMWGDMFLDAQQDPYSGVIQLPGTIQAENFDNGGQNIAYYDLSSGNSGGQYRSTDVDIETTTDTGGGYNVGWMDTGEWLEYTVNVASAGDYDFHVRVAGPNSSPSFKILIDGNDITDVRPFASTGGWQNWTTIIAPARYLTSGQHILRFCVVNGGFNLNKIDVYGRGADAVSCDLGSPEYLDGMTHIQVSDGDTVPWTSAGHYCRENVDYPDRFMYFGVSDAYAYQGNKPDVYITCDYYDIGASILGMDYDSTSGAYTAVSGPTLTNSLTWKTHTFHLTNAYFGNRQNGGADFRLWVSNQQEWGIDTVCVYQMTDTTAPTFGGSINPSATGSLTPTITITAQDTGSGLNVGSAEFAYSVDGGTTFCAYVGRYTLYSKGTGGGGGNQYWYPDFYHPNYTIVSGDHLQYDIYTNNTNGTGAVDLEGSFGNLRDSGIMDQNGLSGHPGTNLYSRAYHQWYHRDFDLSSKAGQTITDFEMGHETDNGVSEFYVRNVIITNNGQVKMKAADAENWTPVSDTIGPGNNGYSSTVGPQMNTSDPASPASCTGGNGTTAQQTVSAVFSSSLMPLVEGSGNRIKYRISDMAGNRATSSTFTITITVSTLNAKAAGTITIDGATGDWSLGDFTTKTRGGQNETGDYGIVGYDGGTCYYGSYAGVLPTSASDHTAKVYSRENATYLYFLIRCDDNDMRYNNPTSMNWANDCAEFYVDPSHNGGSISINNSTSDIQLVIDANNQKNVYCCTSGYATQVLGGVTSAVARDGTGWWLEARIQKTVLDPDPPGSGTIGFDLNFRDNDNNNDPALTTVYTWRDWQNGNPFPSKIPDRWGHCVLP